MANNNKNHNTQPAFTSQVTEYYSYKMPEAMARELLKSRKGEELKMSAQDFLCNYINTEYGLLRKVVSVTTF